METIIQHISSAQTSWRNCWGLQGGYCNFIHIMLASKKFANELFSRGYEEGSITSVESNVVSFMIHPHVEISTRSSDLEGRTNSCIAIFMFVIQPSSIELKCRSMLHKTGSCRLYLQNSISPSDSKFRDHYDLLEIGAMSAAALPSVSS
jgi:hypothetical protein